MKTTIAFGKEGLTLELPPGPQYKVLHARAAPPIADITTALNVALDAPIGCAPLEEIARGKKTAAISVCDITRPAPNSTTLPPLLERLHRAGMQDKDITLCIATGLHREATAAELVQILGSEIAHRYPIVNHDARDSAMHRYLGDTKRGTPVSIHRTFLDAELHITLGFIEQHLMLGFSGGRKLVAPGLAAQETIKVIHSPRFMREALATEGSIEENPLHAELLEVAGMARHDFILDVTLTHEREISGVFAGDPVKAHAQGVDFLRRTSMVTLPERAEAVITSAAGYPLDLTFYQTIKGITAVQHIVKPGGKILVLSQCSEGIGSPEFAEKLREYSGPQHFLDAIRDTPVVVDQWQLEKMALVEQKHPLLIYAPGTRPEQLGSLGDVSFATPQEAIQSLVKSLPIGAAIAVVPDGPYAFARAET
jgi:nickel-dependent lactate racemase